MSITILMAGGLGNQLFQYAAARALSLRLDVPLIIDTRFYANAVPRSSKALWLTDFPIRATVSGYENTLLGPHNIIRRAMRRIVTEKSSRVYREPGFFFDPTFFNVHNNSVVVGNFQSPLYFEFIWDQIQPELDVCLTGASIPTHFKGIPLAEFVAIHVRRGDYVGNSDFELHGARSYYNLALEQANFTGGPLLVFSDDIAFCMDSPMFKGAFFYKGEKDAPPYIDLLAMSRCHVVITANSSYSWWAGWFAHKKGSTVLAPSEWIFGRTSREMEILPHGWIEVSAA